MSALKSATNTEAAVKNNIFCSIEPFAVYRLLSRVMGLRRAALSPLMTESHPIRGFKLTLEDVAHDQIPKHRGKRKRISNRHIVTAREILYGGPLES